jgi:hypothetical protein
MLFLDSYSTYVLILVVNFELQPGPVLAGFLRAFRLTDFQTNASCTFTACFQQLTNSYRILPVNVALSFHEVTNSFFHKPLPFRQIQTAPGVGGQKANARRSPRRPRFTVPLSPSKSYRCDTLGPNSHGIIFLRKKHPGALLFTKAWPRRYRASWRARPLSTGHGTRNTDHLT